MKPSFLLSTTLIALLSTNLTFANSQPRVDQCPSVDVIKQMGFDDVRIFPDNSWVASRQQSNYDTQYT